MEYIDSLWYIYYSTSMSPDSIVGFNLADTDLEYINIFNDWEMSNDSNISEKDLKYYLLRFSFQFLDILQMLVAS